MIRTQQLLETVWQLQRDDLRDHNEDEDDLRNLDLSLGMSVRLSGTKEEDDNIINGGSNLKLQYYAGSNKEKKLTLSSTGGRPLGGGEINGGFQWVSLGDETAAGVIHPWSLAARQKKAAFEQRQPKTAALPPPPPPPPPPLLSQSMSGPPPPAPVVGWPPVRSCRKNMLSPLPSRPSMEADAKRPRKACELESEDEPKKFVKVKMEGLAVGRKIDLTAHNCYQSLSDALRTLFDNLIFGSTGTVPLSSSKECGGKYSSSDLVLLYEDSEGDKMLVGDVPWEMFVISVKRLYLTYNSRT